MDVISKQRIQHEINQLITCPPSYVKQFKVVEKDIQKWQLYIVPDFQPFKGGKFLLNIIVHDEFPFMPPYLFFSTPIYHPNIGVQGQPCLSIIQVDNWKPAVTMVNVLDSLLYLLRFPEPELSVNDAVARQYVVDRPLYMKTAQEKMKEISG